jgi:hypothetical protein
MEIREMGAIRNDSRQEFIFQLLAMTVSALILAGCGGAPTATPIITVVADPGLCLQIKTWVDSNTDGKIDIGEKALAGVRVTITDSAGRFILRESITDTRGEASYAVIGGTDYRVSATAPAGFRLTTSGEISGVRKESCETIVFGFVN